MFERFTDRARQVVILAQAEARDLDHNYVGTEHLLLGLLREGEGIAAQALQKLGMQLHDVQLKVEERFGRETKQRKGHMPFDDRVKKVLELSLREALQLGHNYIGTEHILLGLIHEGEGVGAQILVQLGADLPRVRQQVIKLLAGYQGKEAKPRPSSWAFPSVAVTVTPDVSGLLTEIRDLLHDLITPPKIFSKTNNFSFQDPNLLAAQERMKAAEDLYRKAKDDMAAAAQQLNEAQK